MDDDDDDDGGGIGRLRVFNRAQEAAFYSRERRVIGALFWVHYELRSSRGPETREKK